MSRILTGTSSRAVCIEEIICNTWAAYHMRPVIMVIVVVHCRSQSPCSLRHEPSSLARKIVDSNPNQGMDVSVHLFCVCVVLCIGEVFATG
jgi:hypothetical protein